jgi:predicted amidohydrolase YtcJ
MTRTTSDGSDRGAGPTLITAGAVYAGDPPAATATALVVNGDRVQWVGPVEDAPLHQRTVDLPGAVVIPGFVDSHVHLICLVAAAGWADLRGVRSLEEARTILGDHAATTAAGKWVVGWGFDAARVQGRHLSRADLDVVAPDRPALVVESSFHQGTVNSAALAAVGWGRNTPRWPGGELVRNRRGEPTGMVWERAFTIPAQKAFAHELDRPRGELAREATAAADWLLAQGVTHIGEALSPPWLLDLFEAARLPLGITLLPCSGQGLLAPPYDALDGPRTGEGDGRLGVGPLKLVADGAERNAISLGVGESFRMLAALLMRSMRERDSTGLRIVGSIGTRIRKGKMSTGTLHYSPGALADVTEAALRRGFAVAVHAIGNDALDLALDAFERGRTRTGVDLRGCRLEHAMFATQPQLDRASRLGLHLSMQPGHASQYVAALRATRIERIFQPVPIRWAIDAGCQVAISSDGPTRPGSALDDLRAAVDRVGVDGRTTAPEQAITRTEALRAATAGGAEACGVGDAKGTLAPGRQADFAVLSGDPFDSSTTVLETWIAGRRVWPAAS